jgi:hypothetical protein
MDGRTQDFCNFCIFHDHISSRKSKNPLHHSQTQQKKGKMKRDDMKKREDIQFGLALF